MADSVLLEVDGGVAYITFNRPQRLNALDLAMAGALREAVASLGGRDDVRVVVLRGAGSAFMAGGDVSLFHGEPETVAKTIASLIDRFHELTIGLQRLTPPII